MITESAEQELQRIHKEYSRRKREIPADFYAWNRPVNQFFHCQTYRACLEALVQQRLFPLQGKRVADFGCGVGTWLLEFAQWGANLVDLYGIDLDPVRISQAQQRLPASNLETGDAGFPSWPAAYFDLVTQFTMFTSILDVSVRKNVAAAMLRVLKPTGVILWYDFRFNNPSNRNVRGIQAVEIQSLFPNCSIQFSTVTLAPPLARRVVPTSWILALLLEKLPFLRTHYLAVIQKHVTPSKNQSEQKV